MYCVLIIFNCRMGREKRDAALSVCQHGEGRGAFGNPCTAAGLRTSAGEERRGEVLNGFHRQARSEDSRMISSQLITFSWIWACLLSNICSKSSSAAVSPIFSGNWSMVLTEGLM